MNYQQPAHDGKAGAKNPARQAGEPSPAIGRAVIAVVLVHGITYLVGRGILRSLWSLVPLTLGVIALGTGLGISAVVTSWRAQPNNKGRTQPGHLIAVVLGLVACVPGVFDLLMAAIVLWDRFRG